MMENEKEYSMNQTARLFSKSSYTLFQFGTETIKFIAPRCLEKYEKILTWDNGYIVVMTKYSYCKELVEEYIDLVPILKDLYIDVEKFLTPIKKVEVRYA